MTSTETRSENTMRSTTCSRPLPRWTRPQRPWRRSTKPWPRSNSSTASRLVDTRLTPGKVYLFLSWDVSFFREMGGVLFLFFVAGYDQWPCPRSSSSTASRLVVTRLTPGKHCLFLLWGVLFLGNGRCFCVLMDLTKVKFINHIQIGHYEIVTW